MDKQKKKLSPMILLVLISILLLPAFYSFTYLRGFWNPYQQMGKVPVAFVNMDQPVTKDGHTVDIGKSVEASLKNNHNVKWEFVNYNEAKAGVEGKKYYAMVVIPKDFSYDVANAMTNGFKKPVIDATINQGKSYVFSKIFSAVAQGVQGNISKQVSEATSMTLIQTLEKGAKLGNNPELLKKITDYIANPVQLNYTSLNPVSLYGEGLAPYFICIALWMGAMYTYFVASSLGKKFKGKFMVKFFKVYLAGIIMTILQSVVMGIILYTVLGLNPVAIPQFFFYNALISIAFYSVLNGLHYIIAPIMKGAVIVMFLLQLVSCAGLYPIETSPEFLKVLNPWIPMTYAVNGLKMTISGINHEGLVHDVWMLISFIVVSLVIGYLMGRVKALLLHKVDTDKSELISKKEISNRFV